LSLFSPNTQIIDDHLSHGPIACH